MAKLDASTNNEYEMEAICGSAIYAKELELG